MAVILKKLGLRVDAVANDYECLKSLESIPFRIEKNWAWK